MRRFEIGCGGNEDVGMDVWSHKVGQNRNERIRKLIDNSGRNNLESEGK